ncbi:MAG: CoA-acylating methylmalonate-semialdehyde dehydrogenase [Acidobacteria bacterium]|nr:CoA-acylating methylmalonate-semialdehyde dehydrogenase [Acidobacteriota bacterium]
MTVLSNWIGGSFMSAGNVEKLDVYCPLDGQVIAQVPLCHETHVDQAVQAARAAFPAWSALPIKERAQVFYAYRNLLMEHEEELADLVRQENGKTLDEARAEVKKSIEVTEFACALPQLAAGEVMEVSRGVECRTDHLPLGVVACITPFNFPNMVPNWTIPNALCLGNTMVLKPSELVPLSALRLADLLHQAGLPDGVFNVVHGGRAVVESICDHPGIDAVTFVGSTKVAKLVYARATSHLKRALALGGAKNHLIVLPDAHPEMTATNVAASMSGCAGQRCMAASAMVGVGDVEHIVDGVVQEARKVVPGMNLGAVISAEAKARIERYINEAEEQGAVIKLDGRNAHVPGFDGGYYVGPTVIDHVKPDMAVAREEIFGPVLSIIRADNVDEAIKIENANPYGNAAAVFTQSGGMADYVRERASAGMFGVNIGVPVPREPFSFGGWNESKFGVGDITGKSSIEFFTKLKKTTRKWNPEARTNWMS